MFIIKSIKYQLGEEVRGRRTELSGRKAEVKLGEPRFTAFAAEPDTARLVHSSSHAD